MNFVLILIDSAKCNSLCCSYATENVYIFNDDFFFPNLICFPRRKIFIDLISPSLPPGRYTEFFFAYPLFFWHILKIIVKNWNLELEIGI